MNGHPPNRVWLHWTHSSTAVTLMAGFGLLIGSVIASLGGGGYQNHVSIFHPNSSVYHQLATLFARLLPYAPVLPLLIPVYFCLRVGRQFDYILLLGLLGSLPGFVDWLTAGYLGRLGDLNAMVGCCGGTFAGVIVQKIRDHPRED